MSENRVYLENLIKSYAENKALADRYKKLCDAENKEIKEVMAESDITEFDAEKHKVKLVTATTESFDEEKLLKFAHEKEFNDIIKTKEYIDYDKLEALIYSGFVPQDMLLEIANFKIKKETVQLRISAKKS